MPERARPGAAPHCLHPATRIQITGASGDIGNTLENDRRMLPTTEMLFAESGRLRRFGGRKSGRLLSHPE
jgi:hypothetical protein